MEWHELTLFYATMPEASGGRLENWGMESSEGSFPQASARCWGLAEAVAGAVSEILRWPLLVAWVSSQNGGWVEAVTVMAVSNCCGLHGPRLSLNHRGKWGWGKRFTTASRPGRFQSRHCFQWAAVTRALEFCETQPWACPWAPQLTCR